jgi:hypothetical protein
VLQCCAVGRPTRVRMPGKAPWEFGRSGGVVARVRTDRLRTLSWVLRTSASRFGEALVGLHGVVRVNPACYARVLLASLIYFMARLTAVGCTEAMRAGGSVAVLCSEAPGLLTALFCGRGSTKEEWFSWAAYCLGLPSCYLLAGGGLVS